MEGPNSLAGQRIAIRGQQLDSITTAARQAGATALHVFGSLGQRTADFLSDIDVWLTFPDDIITGVIGDRMALYGAAGDLLLTHEMTSNRPIGGVYTLALYATSTGPLQIDWYLAPQSTSRIVPSAKAVFADFPVPTGDLRLDSDADHIEHQSERVAWLICMLFIALKAIARGGSAELLEFFEDAYRDVCERYAFAEHTACKLDSLAAVGAMLGQLAPYSDEPQCRAIELIDVFQHELGHDGSHFFDEI